MDRFVKKRKLEDAIVDDETQIPNQSIETVGVSLIPHPFSRQCRKIMSSTSNSKFVSIVTTTVLSSGIHLDWKP